MTDHKRVDQAVIWRRSELAWGLANSDVHGLGAALERLTPAGTGAAGDDDQTYIITATEDEISEAVVRVNDWIADLPHGAPGTDAAHGFQRALSIPPHGPEGGEHDRLSDDG